MSNIKLPSFVELAIAVIKGDDAKATALKIQKQAKNALVPQIAVKESITSDLEDQIDQRKENVKLYLVNNGKVITDRDTYIKDLLTINQGILEAEEKLADHLADIAFLQKCLNDVSE